MKAREVRWVLVIFGAAVWFGGCATSRRLAGEVTEAREQAAQVALEREEEVREAPAIRGSLTLEEAIQLALEHNKELQAAFRERDVARGRVLESYRAALPSVAGAANYVRLDERPQMPTAAGPVPMGFEDQYSAEVTVRQPLFHGQAIPSALRVARLYALSAEEAVRSATQGVIFRAAQAYYDALLARSLLDVHEKALELAEALARDVRQKRSAGVASDYDVLRADVEVANARAEWIRQKNAWELAMSNLLKTLGISQRSRITLASELEYRPAQFDESEALAIALRNRPELFQAEYAVRMQREALKIARSEYWPQIGVFFTQSWAKPDPHSALRNEWGDAWRAGIGATLPLFDGLARRGKVLQERARLKQAELALTERQQAIWVEVQQALLSLKNADEWVQSQRMNVERAEEGLRLARAGYREGVRTELDVLDAQTALTRTRALFHQALHAHAMARANVHRALGLLDRDWQEVLGAQEKEN